VTAHAMYVEIRWARGGVPARATEMSTRDDGPEYGQATANRRPDQQRGGRPGMQYAM